MDLKDHIRGIPDFPKPGILFYDISTLLRDADAWQVAMGRMAKAVRAYQPDLLAGIESRGFLIAAPLALKLGCGFIMLRKRGKLPGETVGLDYSLEYGTDRIEMQADAIETGSARRRGGRPAGHRGHHGSRHHAVAQGRRGGSGRGGADRTDIPERPRPARRALRGAGFVRRMTAPPGRCFDTSRVRGRKVSWGDLG